MGRGLPTGRFFSHPVIAAVNFAGSMFAVYHTPAFELSLTMYIAHLLMIVHLTVAGYLFINALIGVDPGPARPRYPLRILLLFVPMASHAFFGVALGMQEELLVPQWFGGLDRPWGLPPLEDQQDTAAIARGVSEFPMIILAMAIARAWTRDDERTARRLDRAADRDGEAELAQYNAMLARLAEGGPGSDQAVTRASASRAAEEVTARPREPHAS